MTDTQVIGGVENFSSVRVGAVSVLSRFSYYNRQATTAITLMVVVILLGASYIALLNTKDEGFAVDGDFSDWTGIERQKDDISTDNPGIDLVQFRALVDDATLLIYLETHGDILQGLGESGDGIQVFIDTDRNTKTGYLLPNLGADYLLEVFGKNGEVLSANVYRFEKDHRTEETRAQNDWNAWSPGFSVEAASQATSLECRVWLNDIYTTEEEMNLMVRLTDSTGNVAESRVFNPQMTSVDVVATIEAESPLLPEVGNHLFTLTLSPKGDALVLDELVFSETSTAQATDFQDFVLYKDEQELARADLNDEILEFKNIGLALTEVSTLSLKVELASSVTPGHVLALKLHSLEASGAAVNIDDDELSSYLVSPPMNHVVDGMFDEWLMPQEDTDTFELANANIDITHFDKASQRDDTFFYLKVEGNMLAGTMVPASRVFSESETPSAGSTDEPGSGGSEAPEELIDLPVKTGEDALYILLDTEPGGYEDSGLSFGADSMIVIKGQRGVVISSQYLVFNGRDPQDWSWQYQKDVQAATGSKEIETMVDVFPQNVYFHLVDWSVANLPKNVIRTGHDDDAYLHQDPIPDMTRTGESWPGSWTSLGTDSDDGIADTDIEILQIYYEDDSSYLYLRMRMEGSPDMGDHTYLFYLDMDQDGSYDYLVNQYDDSGTVYVYFYRWDDPPGPPPAAWLYQAYWTGAVDTDDGAARTTTNFVDFAIPWSILGSDTILDIAGATDEANGIYKDSDGDNGPDDSDNEDYVEDVGGGFGIPEFRDAVLPAFFMGIFFMVFKRKRRYIATP